jgi:hypothetical protein
MRALQLSAQRHILVQHLHDDCCCCCCCCWACCTESVLTYSIKKDFTYKGVDEEVEEERKKKSCMWGEGFITHFTDK